MSKFKDIRINKSKITTNDGRYAEVCVFFYTGTGDPRAWLKLAITEYFGSVNHWVYMDENLDNPWCRVVITGINDMNQYTLDELYNKKLRNKKLKNILK